MRTSFDSISGVSSKARAALMGAGFRDLESLADQDYASVGSIPGIGQRTLERLQSALVKEGKSLGGDVPEAEKRSATWTKLEPAPELPGGRAEAINLINSLDSPKRKDHGILLLNIFFRAPDMNQRCGDRRLLGLARCIIGTQLVGKVTLSGWGSARARQRSRFMGLPILRSPVRCSMNSASTRWAFPVCTSISQRTLISLSWKRLFESPGQPNQMSVNPQV
ncbi:hypothetical protein CDES_00755 [Corynebacterium deserti GIMN1.010]|uniref:Helix-hairpin-helix domain-containing protein n=1 Tax=Corynebacterium deserti GIMN1.010 TaxID=931089 RepID=A0A0M5INS3_9CORY|nr:hypothetical protein CDES_00755 [Corynebacterium deserti GIMN1.010]